MRDLQTINIDRNGIKQVLEKTKTVCTEAFRLICSDTARKEGFFRRTGPLCEKIPGMHLVEKQSEETSEGIRICTKKPWFTNRDLRLFTTPDPEFDSNKIVIIYNPLLSVRATIQHNARSIEYPTAISGIEIAGVQIINDKVRKIAFEFFPQYIGWGIILKACFRAREATIDEVLQMNSSYADPFDYRYFGRLIVNEADINGIINEYVVESIGYRRDVSRVYTEILHACPENNYEMARMALNLLAEFEAMLDSAIRHFGG